MTQRIEVELVYTLGEMAGLENGTRIATNHGLVLTLTDEMGGGYWWEEGQLVPYSAMHEWLPVIVLPPKVKHGEEE